VRLLSSFLFVELADRCLLLGVRDRRFKVIQIILLSDSAQSTVDSCGHLKM
jgi:hypothetical protein